MFSLMNANFNTILKGQTMKRTEAEIKEWKARMAKLAKQVKSMDEAEKQAFIGRNLIITAEGHRLSLRNTCLLLFQSDGFTPVQVGGFRQWQKVGRVVKKGEHSFGCISVPIGIKKDDSGPDDTSDLHFRWVSVFDVSQTEEIAAENTVAA